MPRRLFLLKLFQLLVFILMAVSVTVLCGWFIVVTVAGVIEGVVSGWVVVGGAVMIFLLLFLLLYPIIEQRIAKRWGRLSRVVKLAVSGIKIIISSLFLLCYFLFVLFVSLWMPPLLIIGFVILTIDNMQKDKKLHSLEERLESLQAGGESG
ncbi:MAG: hypothetical protein JW987_11060 [Anaerolineaceae bacterium]|nr:hypothetical protein [Anaerolineaceae bacterium]